MSTKSVGRFFLSEVLAGRVCSPPVPLSLLLPEHQIRKKQHVSFLSDCAADEWCRWVLRSDWEEKVALGSKYYSSMQIHHAAAAAAKKKKNKPSFVHVVSTWLHASAHLGSSFGDVFCTEIAQCLRKKKSYLVGVCLCERGVMLKTLFCARNGHPIRISAGEPH